MSLACPRDATPLRPFTMDGITVDACPKCRGHWLDATELARVTNDEELERLAHVSLTTGKLVCPRCTAGLGTGRIEGVEVDPCPSCRGVWLDSGEIRDAQRQVLVRRWNERHTGLAPMAAAAGR